MTMMMMTSTACAGHLWTNFPGVYAYFAASFLEMKPCIATASRVYKSRQRQRRVGLREQILSDVVA